MESIDKARPEDNFVWSRDPHNPRIRRYWRLPSRYLPATAFVIHQPEAEPLRPQTPPPADRPPVPCERKNCMVGMPLHEQLVRLLDGKTPRHNRGKPKISDPPKFRTAICKHTKKGHCCCDAVCWMAHSKAERRTMEMNIADGIDKASAGDVFIAHSIRVHLGDVGT